MGIINIYETLESRSQRNENSKCRYIACRCQRIYAPRFNTMNVFKKKATTVSREQIGLKENLEPYSFFIALNHSGSVLFISPTFVQKRPKKEKKRTYGDFVDRCETVISFRPSQNIHRRPRSSSTSLNPWPFPASPNSTLSSNLNRIRVA